MRCAGSIECNCTQFRGKTLAKDCKTCEHDRGLHYEPSDDNGGDGKDDGTDSESDDGDDSDSDEASTDSDKQPLASTRKKTTVSSLAADLLKGGEYTGMQVDQAKSEATAGLTRRHVGQTLTCGHKG